MGWRIYWWTYHTFTSVAELSVRFLVHQIYTGPNFFKYLIEDILALSSDEYLRSIEEARTDYKEGKVKYLEEIFDV